MATTGGSIALKDNYPPDDAFMVQKLREAGAIVLAKTNMAEWAFSARQTVSSSYGRTANAYDVNFVPAGSSDGTASGVAASLGVAGMGSDTGNSIRGPSSHLALFGIRSTIGLTSRDGVIPLAFDRDIAGPMTRTVEDGVRLFNIVADYDPSDPLAVPDKREADYMRFLNADGLDGKRLGVFRFLVDHEDADEEIKVLFYKAIDDLAAAGADDSDTMLANICSRSRNRRSSMSTRSWQRGNTRPSPKRISIITPSTRWTSNPMTGKSRARRGPTTQCEISYSPIPLRRWTMPDWTR